MSGGRLRGVMTTERCPDRTQSCNRGDGHGCGGWRDDKDQRCKALPASAGTGIERDKPAGDTIEQLPRARGW